MTVWAAHIVAGAPPMVASACRQLAVCRSNRATSMREAAGRSAPEAEVFPFRLRDRGADLVRERRHVQMVGRAGADERQIVPLARRAKRAAVRGDGVAGVNRRNADVGLRTVRGQMHLARDPPDRLAVADLLQPGRRLDLAKALQE